jgi:hypothetical protein
MADAMNLTMLVCASIGSLALGVLTAYAVLRGAFALMRPQSASVVVKPRPEVAQVL